METIDKQDNNKITSVLRKNGIVFAAIFGSRAKGTAILGSDYDFLIEFSPSYKIPLSRFLPLKESIEKVVKNDVDIITIGGLGKKKFKQEVLSTMKVLYDERKK